MRTAYLCIPRVTPPPAAAYNGETSASWMLNTGTTWATPGLAYPLAHGKQPASALFGLLAPPVGVQYLVCALPLQVGAHALVAGELPLTVGEVLCPIGLRPCSCFTHLGGVMLL